MLKFNSVRKSIERQKPNLDHNLVIEETFFQLEMLYGFDCNELRGILYEQRRSEKTNCFRTDSNNTYIF